MAKNDNASGSGGSGTGANLNIKGTSGNDSLIGGDGNDKIDGKDGDDSILGGDGKDNIKGGSGNDTLDGGAGNDKIDGGKGDDVLLGGDGKDNIKGGSGDDTVDGGAGDDKIDGGKGDDVLLGGDGKDHLKGGSGDDTVDGGAGDDKIDGGKGNDTISGGEGDDRISGGQGDDVIGGNAGDDDIKAGAGNDTVNGGDGNDKIKGGAGDDIIDGGAGDDLIFGDGSGASASASGSGGLVPTYNDTLRGGAGNDVVVGGVGNDTVLGGDGNDTLYGDAMPGSGSGKGSGSHGSHGSHGSASGVELSFNDYLDGGAGNDELFAGRGDDVAGYGAGENTGATDIYDGGSGIDQLQLNFSLQEWLDLNPGLQDDLDAYLDFLAATTDPTSGEADGTAFQFNVFDLSASGFESVATFVDGVEVDAIDDVVTAVDDALVVNEDDGDSAFAGSVFDNDSAPDIVRSITLLSSPAAGILTFSENAAGRPDGSFSFDPDGQFEWLAADESTTVSFDYEVEDSDGDIDQATVTITIIGSNDAPTVTAAVASGAVTEVADNVTGENATTHTQDGTIDFADLDDSDVHTVVVSGGGRGIFNAILVNDSTTDNVGQVAWDFAIDDEDIDDLAAGQVLSQTYDVTIDDGNDGAVTQTITVTITGSNDGPTVTAAVASGAVTELTDSDADENAISHTQNGTIDFADVDDIDTHTVSVSGGGRGIFSASITNDSTTDNVGQVAWDFAIDDADIDDLAEGQVLSQSYDVTIEDGQGGAATQTVTVTITGTNDAPVAMDDIGFSTLEDTPLSISSADLLSNDSDVDLVAGESLSLTAVSNATGGTVGLNAITGEVTFTPDENYSGPASFEYTVSDGLGLTDTATVSLNVEAVADAPMVTVPGDDDSGNGGEWRDEQLVNTNTSLQQIHSEVATLNDGGHVVVWMSNSPVGPNEGEFGTSYNYYRVFGQRYDADGNSLGGEFQVNTYTTDDQAYPSVAALADGGFAVSWSSTYQDGSDYGIFGQRYDSSGDAAGGEFQINTHTSQGQYVSTMSGLADGGFVVIWNSDGQDSSSYGIFGQRYDANGNPTGSEFRANTYTSGIQFNESYVTENVAGLADGGFVVIWHDENGRDSSGYAMFGQRFDANGDADGAEFQINTYSNDDQRRGSVDALKDGGFVVSWTSAGQDGSGLGIFAQRYDADGDAVGDEFQVNTATDSDQNHNGVTGLADGGFVITWSSANVDGSDDFGGVGDFGPAHDRHVARNFRLGIHGDMEPAFPR
ncbi:MAG: tandem-95 repeat protein [Rhodospirillaceae bacterium]|jgi:VCBS repeat-containing protein|nr:tandem-95 repeat protein [Rhodospirillaceae bacterium]